MPVQEVARTLGVPSGTVKVRLARGRSALAAQLGDQQRRSDLGMTELEERLRRFAEEGARQAHPEGWRRRSDVAGFAAAWSERSAWRW
jgi:Sigma-70, region 4